MATPVTVLGAGNGGQCMAADLALRGVQVTLFELEDFSGPLKAVAESKVIELRGIGATGSAQLRNVTFDAQEALDQADLLCLVTPAFAHQRFFEEILPYLRDDHTVVIWAGDFGSLALHHLIRERRPGLATTIVETNTLPYGTRLAAPGRVDLLLVAPSVVAAALPATQARDSVEGLRQWWPSVSAAPDVLGAALSNPNPIVHPAGSLLNAGRIEYSGGDFYMYREGITEAVARAIRRTYEETKAVATSLGTEVLTYETTDFTTTASIMGVAFQAPFDTIGTIARVAGPKSIRDRYITEDLPFGLVPISELAKIAEVPTPVIDGLIEIGSAACDEDFRATGRTLESLGLKGHGKNEIFALVR